MHAENLEKEVAETFKLKLGQCRIDVKLKTELN
jgi:hypothetical protein